MLKKNAFKKLFSVILCAVIMLLCVVVSFAEGEAVTEPSTQPVNVNSTTKVQEAIDAIKNVKTELICISKYGNVVSYPENSIEGIVAAAENGADMVLVRVNKTADGQIVLFSDGELSRMCVDKDGNAVTKKLSEINYDELKTYFLRNGKGNAQEKITAYAVPTLKQTVETLDKRAILLIENGWEFRNELYDILSECNAAEYTALITDAGKSEISKWQASKPSAPMIVTEYDGTVVWKSKSYIKKSASLGAVGVLLRNNNAYSTTFSKSTLSKANGKTRAMIDMTNPKLCGNRQDTSVYWDDVTSRGFSMIITDNVEQFIEYRLRVEQSRLKLENLTVKALETDTSLYSPSSAKALKTAISKAEYTAENSVCAMELENTYNALNTAYISLQQKGDKDKGTATYTTGRIFAAVIVSVLLVIMELAFEVLRNKSIALRKNGKKLFFSKKKKNRIKFK